MIIDYYKFKKDLEVSTTYNLTFVAYHSHRIPPERIKFVTDKDIDSIKKRYRLVFGKESTAYVIFPSKNKGIGFFESGTDLILVNWFPQISRIHIIIILDKKMYAEVLYQMFINGLIDFNLKPTNPDAIVQ
jgi:hypothetical protein